MCLTWNEWKVLLQNYDQFCLSQGGRRLAWDIALMQLQFHGALSRQRVKTKHEMVLLMHSQGRYVHVDWQNLSLARTQVELFKRQQEAFDITSEWSNFFHLTVPSYPDEMEMGKVALLDLNALEPRARDSKFVSDGPDQEETRAMMRSCYEVGAQAWSRCGAECARFPAFHGSEGTAASRLR